MSDHPFALFGQTPAKVLEPESIGDVQDAVRALHGQAIVPWGGGTRQGLGYPPDRYDAALSVLRLTEIVSYQPDDLTVTVQAGATVTAIQNLLSERKQRLAVEVPIPDRATIGGAIASRANSLFRFSSGSTRDAILGTTVINYRAEVIKGGGRVVKNVSGYDLPKLYCGSLGTLGVIVEATLRVVPVPESSQTVVLPLPAGRNSEEALDTLLTSDLCPAFLYLISSQSAPRIIPEARQEVDAQYLVLGFDGSADAVDWQLKTLDPGDGLLGVDDARTTRAALRDFPARYGTVGCSFHLLSSQAGAFLRMLEWTADRSNFTAHIIADAAVGMMWAHFSPRDKDADWDKFARELTDKAVRCGGSFVIDEMPEQWRSQSMPVWSPILPDFALMKKTKESFDPAGMWNPGRFVGGI